MSDIKKTFDSLSSTNWGQWVDNMQAYLATKELWEYVDGSALKPVPADPDHPTASELKDLGDWKRKTARAGGELWLAIEDSQKVHVKELKGDPVAVWEKLRAVHLQQRPGARFNAYEALFSIRKQEDESLSDLMARADKAMQDIKALRPDKFTLDDLDKELLSMTLIRALPTEYNNFASSLLLLDSLDIDKLKSAFQNEQSQRQARHLDPTSPSLAHTASTSPVRCDFCGKLGHLEKDCFQKADMSKRAKENTNYWRGRGRGSRGRGRGQNAKEAVQEESGSSAKVEIATNASALSASDRAKWLQSRASSDWNTDTGASSHMTPHRHWFRSYSPHIVPVRIADNTIIYSAGIGSVEFQPVIKGIPKRQLCSMILSMFLLLAAIYYRFSTLLVKRATSSLWMVIRSSSTMTSSSSSLLLLLSATLDI
jgi:hypothetical protein